MDKIVLLSGTKEARKIVEFLRGTNVQVFVGKVSELGEGIAESKNIKLIPEILDASGMKYFIRKNGIKLVIDATNPIAADLAGQIENACKAMHINYQRVLGMQNPNEINMVYLETIQDAVTYLKNKMGKILIATGSKDLVLYKEIPDYKERCYARVASTKEAMAEGTKLGFEGRHLIAMQGPFTELMNEAVLRQTEAEYIVLKETGSGNGFMETVLAAQKTNTKLVIIGREMKLDGESAETVCAKLEKEYSIDSQRKIWLIGMGTGSNAYLTERAKELLEQADMILGASEVLGYVKENKFAYQEATHPKEICDYIKSHQEFENIAIGLSGDANFYSGAKRIRKVLNEYDIEMIPGISSVSYLAASLHKEIEDAAVVSVQGKSCNVIGALKNTGKVFVLMNSGQAVNVLCDELIRFGYGKIQMSVGSRLSFDDEVIVTGYPNDCKERSFCEPVIVYLEERKWTEPIVTYGFPNEEFDCGTFIPTASEARSIAISKLQLQRDAIVYDVNAGYGAFSVEIARQVLLGTVYSIEKEEQGIQLIKSNQERFAAANVILVKGTVPEAFTGLPMPTHAIVSGYNENMDELLDALMQKNKHIHIVVSSTSLRNISECLAYLKKRELEHREDVSCITVAKENGNGEFKKMEGEDPVYIIAFGGKK